MKWFLRQLFKVKSFLVVMLGGRIEDKEERDRIIRERLAICSDCEHVRKKNYIDQETFTSRQHLYCGQCGCGTHALAELNVKLGFKQVKCPLDPPKWGVSEAMTPKQGTQVVSQQMQTEMMKQPEYRKRLEEASKKNEERSRQAKERRDAALRERGIDPADVDQVHQQLREGPVPHMTPSEMKALVGNDVIKKTMVRADQEPQTEKEQPDA